MNTKERYITYEQAKKFKKLGFHWQVPCFYASNKNLYMGNPDDWNSGFFGKKDLSAPSQSVAIKFLREVLKWEVFVLADFNINGIPNGKWTCFYRQLSDIVDMTSSADDSNQGYDTYEDAMEAAIDKTLWIIEELKKDENH